MYCTLQFLFNYWRYYRSVPKYLIYIIIRCTFPSFSLAESPPCGLEISDTNKCFAANNILVNKFLVSKETVVLLHQWEIETRKFGFIKQVDKGQITAVKDLEK